MSRKRRGAKSKKKKRIAEQPQKTRMKPSARELRFHLSLMASLRSILVCQLLIHSFQFPHSTTAHQNCIALL